MKTVQYGSKGSSVTTLQEALVNQGYEIDVDGDFGDGTHGAVVDFQSNNGLDADGIVGEATWAALGYQGGGGPSAKVSGGNEMIDHGSKGSAVRKLQQALVDLGYEIDVDGDFGDGTYNAVVDFQSNNGLDADGVVGPNTWSALGF